MKPRTYVLGFQQGYKDSNLDYRSQNPASCQLNDSPSVKKRSIRNSK